MTEPRNSENRIKVLLVEDHPVVAEGLSSLLQDYDDLMLVGVAGSVAEATAIVDRICPDVAVIDYHLPDGTGTDVADIVRARCSSAAIVFLSADDSDERLIEAIEAGATSYVLKSASGEEIVGSIRAAAAGQTAIPAGAIASALAARRESARQRAERDRLLGSLTPRERQVLVLMISGADNLAMADALHISYATVRTHVRSILTKLGAHSQLDAVAKATQMGFED